MKVLVTGATGFVGSHVANALVSRGDTVHAITRSATIQGRTDDLAPGITWHQVDAHDRTALGATVRAVRPDAAIHLAWYAEPGMYLHDVPENLRSLQSTINVLEALLEAHCARVVLAGSGIENVPPSTIYAAAKASAHAVAAQLRRDGLAATCAHIFYTYGRREDPRRVVPTVIRALLREEHVAVGDGSEVRDYVHVTDIAAAFCALLNADPGTSVDICSGRTVHLRDVFEIIGRETGRGHLIQLGANRVNPVIFPATGDPALLRDVGWRPTMELEDGLRDAIDYWASELPAGS